MLKLVSAFLVAYSLVVFLTFLSLHRGVLEPSPSKLLPSRNGRRLARSGRSDSDADDVVVASSTDSVPPFASVVVPRGGAAAGGVDSVDSLSHRTTSAAKAIRTKTARESDETIARKRRARAPTSASDRPSAAAGIVARGPSDGGGGVFARRRGGRFPSFGTEEFARRCDWALPSPPLPGGGREGGGTTTDDDECIIFVRPEPNGNEGVSLWMSQIVTGYIVSKQTGCHLLFDYGPIANVTEAFVPFANANDWRVPDGFRCLAKDGCFPAPSRRDHAHLTVPFDAKQLSTWKKGWTMEKEESTSVIVNVADAPNYRFAFFAPSSTLLIRSHFRELLSALPGFDIETGYACALGTLLRLSPSAAKYEKGLFDEILPSLRDEDALVLTLYVRTHRADKMATNEEAGKDVPAENVDRYDQLAKRHVKCALSLEERYLKAAETSRGARFSRIVWMLVTDSTELKRRIKDAHDSSNVHAAPPPASPVSRTVLTTGTRGVHTRTRRDPSTADLVEALIDWYLIGESDLVVMDGPSFGATGGLRTARPIYDAALCSEGVLVT